LYHKSNSKLSWKGLLGTDALAYFNRISVTKKKGFITLTSGTNVIRLFTFAINEFSW